MMTKEIAIDGLFVGHDRLWISTAEIDPGVYQTIEYGPGARVGAEAMYCPTEGAARIAHEHILASYGYRKTGMRQWEWFRKLEFLAKGMVNVSRRPASRKSVWIMAGFWAFALLCAGVSIATGSILWGLIIGSLDAYMLYQCIMGLLWSYNIPRQGRRRKI